jgi:hypothetical protein
MPLDLPVNLSTALPELVCDVRYASDTRVLRQAVSADPYGGGSVDLDARFRFKAVVLGTPDRIDHITLTVYDLEVPGGPMVVQQAHVMPPFNTGTVPPALNGWQHVYSSVLGRELRYGCALQVPLVAGPVP